MSTTIEPRPADQVPEPPSIPVGGPSRRDVRDTPLPLVAFAGLLVLLGVAVGWWAVAAVVGIVLMIFLHELGHYLAAKKGGMKVTEFFLGFGPRLWSFTRGETTYGLKAVPFGAYVKVIGMSNLEEVDPEDEPRTYRQATYPRKLAVAVAGSTMHFLQAFVLLFVVYGLIGVPTTAWRVREITDGSAAAAAGVQPGDRLLTVDGEPVGRFSNLSTLLATKGGLETTFTYERDGQVLTGDAVVSERFTAAIADAIEGLESRDRLVQVDGAPVSRYADFAVDAEIGRTYAFEVYRRDQLCTVKGEVRALPPATDVTNGFLGVAPDYDRARESLPRAVGRSLGDFGRVGSAAVRGIGRFFQPSSIGSFVSDTVKAPTEDESVCRSLTADENRVMSIYGFGRVASDAGRDGFGDFIALFALFNIFIGIFNLLPTLPFDGGHVVVATYERIRSRGGRRYVADMSKAMPIVYAVAGIMVFLGVLALFRDIVQPISIGG